MLFHKACLSAAPESHHRAEYQAIVCGARLPLNDFAQDLRTTGLLHLLVVSGTHLAFLETALELLLKHFKWMRALVFPGLLIFALVTRLQPPVVRSALSLLLSRISSHFQFCWTPLQRTVISGIFSFAFCHGARDIQSLLLSWGAALALASCPRLDDRGTWRDSVLRNLWIYLILAPLLAPMGVVHPGAILTNWLIAPWIGLALFPMSIATFLIPACQAICDPLWTGVSFLIAICADHMKSVGPPLALSSQILWVYLGCFSLLGLGVEPWVRRQPLRLRGNT